MKAIAPQAASAGRTVFALALLAALWISCAPSAAQQDWPPKGAAMTQSTLFEYYDFTVENRGWEKAADGALVRVRIYAPRGKGPFPAAVFTPPPGRAPIAAPGDIWNPDGRRAMDTAEALAKNGVAAVLYNPPGRGIEPYASTGQDDRYGYMSQDALAAVVRAAARAPIVNPANIGVVSEGEALGAALGALARHPDLSVRWLLDAEGPWDNLEITGYTWDQISPYSADKHMEKASLYWQHWPSARDETPENLDRWRKREPRTYFQQARVRFYQRVQYEYDHAQPPGYFAHAARCYEAALASPFITYARVNRLLWNEPLPAHRQPAPLPGAMDGVILPLASWVLDLAALPDAPADALAPRAPRTLDSAQ